MAKIIDEGVIERAKIIGFDNVGYDTQRIIFNKARMFGWNETEPSVLGSFSANLAVESAIDYLVAQGVCFKKAQ